MTEISRRAAIGATLALPLAAPSLRAQALTKLRVSVIPVLDVAPLHAAIRHGYFAAEGIEIDTSTTAGGATGLPGVVAGQFRMAFTNTVSALLGVREGLDFRFVAPAVRSQPNPPDSMAILVRKGSGITNGKQLEGKRVASNTRNNIVWLRGMAWIDKTGGEWRKVNAVEVPFPQMADALAGGQIDAGLFSEPFVTAALQAHGDKLERIGWFIHETAPASSVAQYVAMKEDAERNAEVFERFARGLAKGTDWVNERLGKPELLELISGFSRVPVERLRDCAFTVYVKEVTEAEIAEVIATMTKFGLGGRFPEPSQLIFRTAKA
ncbi:NitT/TauT family transport system substrate-binding protein [Roseomonas rosea]|uniref:NitT/TauT family transport system substrate-binding protein n=1 Tax=Muricoccus roseus TaxID=198092 RepID=A0A1M6IKN4_9PROT|nr:ABC transporter substrate-binding protein [Roseomonas rosea]SHJ35018.1 NitT/TauT family transport system substrate-binding protein [Roseomonas rosea]